MIHHPFPPLYNKNSKVLILGSFPSVKSREQMFFYGHPQNRFWKVISAVTGKNTPETIEEKKSLLLSSGIALWDVIASCEIEGSSDNSIKNAVANDLTEILSNADIKQIFVNGKTAEKYYNKHIRDTIGRDAVCLPSTSPANAAWSVEKLVDEWKILNDYICPVIEQISHTYTAPYNRKCVSCRAVIVKDGKILLSHETKTGYYMSPGGGIEEGETSEECVKREVLEETGYIVNIIKPFVTINEYSYDTLYVSRYFLCEVTGKGEAHLTETEKFKKMAPAWVDINEATKIFGTYKEHTPDKESLYLREYTILNLYKENRQ